MAADDTKAKLQDSALTLFVERGFAETTTKVLAQKAGVAEGTIYRHYASKDDLVRDLFERYYARCAEDIRSIAAETRGGIDAKLTAIARFICELYDSNPTLYRFLLLAQYQAIPIIRSVPNGPAAILGALIADSIARREIPQQNAQVSAAMVLGAIVQPAMGLIYGSVGGRMANFHPQISAACAAILRAPNVSRRAARRSSKGKPR